MHQHNYKYVTYCNTNGLEYTHTANSILELQEGIEEWYAETQIPMDSQLIDDTIIIDDFQFFVYSKLEDVYDKFKEEVEL
jgi:hypothetical protein